MYEVYIGQEVHPLITKVTEKRKSPSYHYFDTPEEAIMTIKNEVNSRLEENFKNLEKVTTERVALSKVINNIRIS